MSNVKNTDIPKIIATLKEADLRTEAEVKLAAEAVEVNSELFSDLKVERAAARFGQLAFRLPGVVGRELADCGRQALAGPKVLGERQREP